MYWRYDTVLFNMQEPGKLLGHAAGQQLKRVDIDDTVWVVTVQPKTGRLLLVTRLVVGWKGNQADAAKLLGESSEDLWEADWHILTQPNPSEPYNLTDITALVPQIWFDSNAGHNQLLITDKGVSPQALQTMRVLTDETAMLLDSIWISEDNSSLEDPAELEATLPQEVLTTYVEGKRKLIVHYQRERNKTLVAKAKEHFKKNHEGQLYCEVCDFNFGNYYGKQGEGFIEAHHKKPFADATSETIETSMADLEMVCANCHRMLHRFKNWLSTDDLRSMIRNK
jgi:hypothetical protein